MAEASGDKERVAEGRAWRVTFLVELGDLAAAERDVHAIARLADALRQPLYRLVAASRRSTLAVLAGRFDEALRLACEAWQIGVRGREPDADAVHWGQIFAIFSETGVPDAERERMEATARRLAALSPLGDAHAAGLALICLRRGHTDEALARFEALARRGFADLPRDMTYVWCLTLLATLCVALGGVGRAAKLYDALAPYQGRCAVGAGAVTCAGAVDRHLGALDAPARSAYRRRLLDPAPARSAPTTPAAPAPVLWPKRRRPDRPPAVGDAFRRPPARSFVSTPSMAGVHSVVRCPVRLGGSRVGRLAGGVPPRAGVPPGDSAQGRRAQRGG